ncbi:MAG: uridine kinase [Pseudonocardia sp.]
MQITPISFERLVEEVAELVAARAGRVRIAVDGAPPTRPGPLADAVARQLRSRGRPVLVVAATDYLRPASVRLESGRTNPDAFLDGWLDVDAVAREVLDPSGPDGSGRVLPRLWNAATDRSYRDDYVDLAPEGVLVLTGSLLLGRELPLDLAVHLRLTANALARLLDEQEHWTLPAYRRYETENDPAGDADLLVLADHLDRLAVSRRG